MAAFLGSGLSFMAGFACRSGCGSLPCQARLSSSARQFKLSVSVHSADIECLNGGPGLVTNQRPYVGISVGDKTKETELGDWSKERGQWCFNEAITVLVDPREEITLSVACSTRYNLYVAALSVTSQRMGEICFPVSSVLSRLRAEDRDTDGIVYCTSVIGFDVVQEGRVMGRVYLSFETSTPPPSQKPASDVDKLCGWGSGVDMYRGDDVSTTASARTSRDRNDADSSFVVSVLSRNS
eukprot:TRINITY_DN51376_c0_g1_i1.p1 TRINITY_DN51376_c0_g1~~TRINITY_DN51376_c0_g1_i1.p1  ORF type:complete len:239 (-),score=30.41 TRINITY_DN51376_c0_g1_i1:266-982(-)